MKCGNCGRGNEYDATICVYCHATLALTEYYRPQGFVEEKNRPTKVKQEPWEQEILTAGYRKRRPSVETEDMAYSGSAGNGHAPSRRTSGRKSATSAKGNKSPAPPKKEKTTSRSANATSKETKRKSAPVEKKSPSAGGTNSRKQKKAPKIQAYNHTTRSLSLAEKEIQKKAEKAKKKEQNRASKTLLAIIIGAMVLIVAAGIFIGTMHRSTDTDRFTQVAEAFVQAVVMDDEDALGDYVHPKMYGTLRPVDYENVSQCDTKVVQWEEQDRQEVQQMLQDVYGISDPLIGAYRVRVGCTIYGDSTFARTMDVLVADIGGSVYAVKIEVSQ